MGQFLSITTSSTEDLGSAALDELRSMLEYSFGEAYDQAAWENCLGGMHFFIRHREKLIGHASVIPRFIAIGGTEFRAGYMESAAMLPEYRGRLYGTAVVAAASAYTLDEFDLGALATGSTAFYERTRWKAWTGRSFVVRDGVVTAASPHGKVMVL